jgi:hypothetical protein
MTALKLKPTAATEAEIQASVEEALLHLHSKGRVAWFSRINGGGMMVSGRGGKPRYMAFYRLHGFGATISKGMSDVIGQLSCGRFFALECKRKGEKATPEQAAYLARVNEFGGVGAVVYGVEDVFAVIV